MPADQAEAFIEMEGSDEAFRDRVKAVGKAGEDGGEGGIRTPEPG